MKIYTVIKLLLNDYIFFLKVESNHTGLLNPEAEAK